MKHFKLLLLPLLAMTFVFSACEKQSNLTSKNATIVDIMELYGKSRSEIRTTFSNFYIDGDENSAEWTILQKKNTMTEIHGYECLISLEFNRNGICTKTSFFTKETRNSSLILDYLFDAYGKVDPFYTYDDWYTWTLNDNSTIQYFGEGDSTGLLIYREKYDPNYAPQMKINKYKKQIESMK